MPLPKCVEISLAIDLAFLLQLVCRVKKAPSIFKLYQNLKSNADCS